MSGDQSVVVIRPSDYYRIGRPLCEVGGTVVYDFVVYPLSGAEHADR